MKRQNHRMTESPDNEWPAEDMKEKANLTPERYQHAVAEMAYGLWEKRGHPQDSANTDWFSAEATIKHLWSSDQSVASQKKNTGKL